MPKHVENKVFLFLSIGPNPPPQNKQIMQCGWMQNRQIHISFTVFSFFQKYYIEVNFVVFMSGLTIMVRLIDRWSKIVKECLEMPHCIYFVLFKWYLIYCTTSVDGVQLAITLNPVTVLSSNTEVGYFMSTFGSDDFDTDCLSW